jgi:hypothetical protein
MKSKTDLSYLNTCAIFVSADIANGIHSTDFFCRFYLLKCEVYPIDDLEFAVSYEPGKFSQDCHH